MLSSILCNGQTDILFSVLGVVLEINPLFEIIVEGKAIDEEIPNFKPIKFLFVFDQFHWESLSFLCDQTCGDSRLKDTNFWENNLNFSVHFLN